MKLLKKSALILGTTTLFSSATHAEIYTCPRGNDIQWASQAIPDGHGGVTYNWVGTAVGWGDTAGGGVGIHVTTAVNQHPTPTLVNAYPYMWAPGLMLYYQYNIGGYLFHQTNSWNCTVNAAAFSFDCK